MNRENTERTVSNEVRELNFSQTNYSRMETALPIGYEGKAEANLTVQNSLCSGWSFEKLPTILVHSVSIDFSRSKVLSSYPVIPHAPCRCKLDWCFLSTIQNIKNRLRL